MDNDSPRPTAWLRFGVDGTEGIYLSDRHEWSDTHRGHGWTNRGTIVGWEDRADRYLVAAFPLATTELRPCEVCGEPNALILGDGVGHILYSGSELEVAERIFEDAFRLSCEPGRPWLRPDSTACVGFTFGTKFEPQ